MDNDSKDSSESLSPTSTEATSKRNHSEVDNEATSEERSNKNSKVSTGEDDVKKYPNEGNEEVSAEATFNKDVFSSSPNDQAPQRNKQVYVPNENDPSIHQGLGAEDTAFLLCRPAPTDTNGGTNSSGTNARVAEEAIQNATGMTNNNPSTNPLPNPWPSTETEGAQNDLEDMLLRSLRQGAASISESMLSIVLNTHIMSQMLNANARQRDLLHLNSLKRAMQNPEFLSLASSPETLQRFLSFQQALRYAISRQQPTRELGQTTEDMGQTGEELDQSGGELGQTSRDMGQIGEELGQTSGDTASLINVGVELLSGMFGELGAGGRLAVVPNRSNETQPLEHLYAAQLSQLQEMGFSNTQENIRAIIASSGNVHAAIERLLRRNSSQ